METVRPFPELELRVPSDSELLDLVRTAMRIAQGTVAPGMAAVEPLAALVVSPIDAAAVALARKRERDWSGDAPDAVVWVVVLMKRHGRGFFMRCLCALLGVAYPVAEKVPRGKPR